MKNYLVAAYKMTPSQPTFLEGRDALLAAARAFDTTDYVLFMQAFAKRRAGVGAVSPGRFSFNNVGVTESYDTIPEATYTGATLDDGVSSCDQDGVLVAGETGRLTVSLKNMGSTTLSGTTVTVTPTTTLGVTPPDGDALRLAAYEPLGTATASVNVALAHGQRLVPRQHGRDPGLDGDGHGRDRN